MVILPELEIDIDFPCFISIITLKFSTIIEAFKSMVSLEVSFATIEDIFSVEQTAIDPSFDLSKAYFGFAQQ